MNLSDKNTFGPKIDRYYIDVTTNKINEGTGVFGQHNNFTVNIQTLNLDQNKNYTVEIQSFYYRNIVAPVGVYPIVLCDLGDNINVNSTNASILYKSNIFTGDNNFIVSNYLNTNNFIRPVRSNQISTFQISIVRSDNGQPFEFANPSDSVQLVLLIRSEQIFI